MVWSHPYDGWFYLVLAVGLVGLLVLAFRFARAPSARSKALLSLRAGALGVLVSILLNPMRVKQTRHMGPEPEAVFLLDLSRSMSLETPASRAQAVDRLIRGAEGLVQAGRRPAIQRFGFGRDLFALSEPAKVPRPEADETRLASALEQLPARFGETLPFAVFVFSDGRSTERTALDSIARAYRELGVPIHVAPVGDERISGDVAVQDIDAPRDARPGTRIPIRVTVRSRAYDGERTELRIRSAANPKRDALATLPITLSGGEQAHDLLVDTDQAKGPLTVEVTPLPHEAIASNNIVRFQISPREGEIRVIYMEGSAPPEYRFLHDALEEDPKIKCLSMYVDNQYVASQVLHRIGDPRRGFPTTREELLSYDVVICSDIARSAFTREQLEWTVELVSKRGGGFAMIGGHTSFGSGGWDQTVWDGLIPVDMSGKGRAQSEFYDGIFQVVIPPRAALHPIWRIVDDPERNRQVLDRMPAFSGTNLTDRLKPAATVLGLSDRPLPGSAVVTVFSCQSFGRGRTFAMATDTTYAWGTEFEKSWGEGDNRYFRKFWRNVVRWLSENSPGANRRLRAETDKVFYRPGQPIEVTARAFDEKLAETDAYRVVARLRGPTETESQPFDATAANLVSQLGDPAFRGTLTTPPASKVLENPGSTVHPLVLDVAALDGDQMVAHSSLDLQVIDDPAEFQDPRPDPSQLKELAEATAGRVIQTPADLAVLLAAHPEATVSEVVTRSLLWDTPLLWLLLLGLLASEWILRRLKGLA
ncbi:MAG: glutamine amidotransferase [Isosphaerales bacterium]